jgi:hypothetical protein
MKKQEILLNVLRLHKVSVKKFLSDQLITSDSLRYSLECAGMCKSVLVSER